MVLLCVCANWLCLNVAITIHGLFRVLHYFVVQGSPKRALRTPSAVKVHLECREERSAVLVQTKAGLITKVGTAVCALVSIEDVYSAYETSFSIFSYMESPQYFACVS